MIKKTLALLAALSFATISQAATTFTLDSWRTDNIIAQPFYSATATGSLVGGLVLGGDVAFSSDHFYGIDYSATWTFDLLAETLTASNVSCAVSVSAAENACLGNGPDFIGPAFLAEGDTVSVQRLERPGEMILVWQTSDNLGSRYSFELTEVPIPAAGWLFATALLGLSGLKRSRLTVRNIFTRGEK